MFARIKRVFGIGSSQKQQEDEHQLTRTRKRQKVENPSAKKNESNDLKKEERQVVDAFLKELELVFKLQKEIPKRFVQSLKEEIEMFINDSSMSTPYFNMSPLCNHKEQHVR